MSQTLYVNPTTGNDGATGSQNAPLKTITQALTSSTPTTTIQLASGTYNPSSGEVFPLYIPTGVTVVGDESSKGNGILIQGGGTFMSPTAASQNITFRLDDQAQLRGVTVTNPNLRGSGVWIESTSPTIANNTFTQCKREGVFATGTSNPTITDNVFLSNDSYGVALESNAKGEIRGNRFENTGYAISTKDDTAPLIINNQILKNRSGIIVGGSAKPIIRQNLFDSNVDDGITIIISALPDLGSAQDPGKNIFRNNGQFDLQNATSVSLVALGNQLNPDKIKGAVDFGAIPTPVPQPAPTPAPIPSPAPQPVPTPAPIPSPAPQPVPNPAPIPSPAPQPVPTPAPVPTPTPAPVPSVKLTDIANHWTGSFIEGLVSIGAINGFPDGTFQPDAKITRAQYAALLVKTFKPSAKRNPSNFKDVDPNFWAAQVIQQAYRGGFLSGFPDNTFHPNENLQRVQVMVSLVNGLGLTSDRTLSLQVFTDHNQIPNWGQDEVTVAATQGLIVNYPTLNNLNPTQAVTRAEVTMMVYQAKVYRGELAALDSPYIFKAPTA